MKLLRVFIRRTSFTPSDELVFIGDPPLFRPEADEVHISCVFTWDKREAERLQRAWSDYYPNVKLGGCAYCGSGKFIPGRYVKQGITFTTRGCRFNCPWCLVKQIEGNFREINIEQGNIIQDNNILCANRNHIDKVFIMLKTQKAIQFKGGVDTRLLKDWHIEGLRGLRIKEIWLALDSDDRIKTFKVAVEKLKRAGFNQNKLRTFILAGFNEPIENAEGRARLSFEIGTLPFMQGYIDNTGRREKGNKIIRYWSRPAIYKSTSEGGAR